MERARLAARKMKEEIDRMLKELPPQTPEEREARFLASVRKTVGLACNEFQAMVQELAREKRWQAENDRKRGSKGPKLTLERMKELVAAWSDNPSASSTLSCLCDAGSTSGNTTSGA